MAAIEQTAPLVLPEVDEREARAGLRAQIARLERELATAALDACPRLTPARRCARSRARGCCRSASSSASATRWPAALATLHAPPPRRRARQAEARGQLERMLADPPAHKWLRVSNEDLGVPGCAHFHVRPRLGPIGLLLNWWRVKISSGCPLAGGRDRRRAPASRR